MQELEKQYELQRSKHLSLLGKMSSTMNMEMQYQDSVRRLVELEKQMGINPVQLKLKYRP